MSFVDPLTREQMNPTKLKEKLQNASVIYFGELHNQEEVLAAQLEIANELVKMGKVVLVLEMFNLDQQELLDRYLQEKISFEELEEEYKKSRENFPLEHYGQLVNFAKKRKDIVEIRAGFIPREIAAQYVREGQKALEGYEKINPRDYIAGHEEHKEYFAELIQDANRMNAMKIPIRRLFEAQVLKDSTMAKVIAEVISEKWKEIKEGNTRVYVIAGRGHVDYFFGVPERVAHLLEKQGRTIEQLIITTMRKEEKMVQKNGRYAGDVIFQIAME